MDSDEEMFTASPEDLIIIEGVENYPLLYDRHAYQNVGYAYSDIPAFKSLAYKDISHEILKKLDKEMSGDEVKSRWTAIRNGFCRAMKNGKKYYLEDYLTFLKPHIKQKKSSVKKCNPIILQRKTFSTADLSNDHCTGAHNSENNDDSSKDVCTSLKKRHFEFPQQPCQRILKESQNLKENDEVYHAAMKNDYKEPLPIKSAQNINESNENEDEFPDVDVCSPSELPCNKQLNSSESMYAWKLLNETSFFEQLQKDLSSLPEEEFFPCMSNIFNSIHYHKYFK